MIICPICGNEVKDNYSQCPFCGAIISGNFGQDLKKLTTFNIEKNMPTCYEAESLLYNKIIDYKSQGIKVLKIIHGYGSSGRGGELRFCLREYLGKLERQKIIKFWVAGEEFSSSFATGKKIIQVFKWIKSDFDYKRLNKGITLIVL